MLYPKISGPFKRNPDNTLNRDEWAKPEFSLLASGVLWRWSEKIDGMNMRVVWDGYSARFAGRTDRAHIPADLLARMEELFPEELLEQAFGAKPAVLFGEGFGPGIQNGGSYGLCKDFVLFDAYVREHWLAPERVFELAQAFDCQMVPPFAPMTLRHAISEVSDGFLRSEYGSEVKCEGMVGTVEGGLLNRFGERIQVKLKVKDLARCPQQSSRNRFL